MKVVATLLVVFLAIAVAEEAAPQYGISTGNAAAFTAPDELVESTADVEGGKSCFVVYPCLGGDITVTRSACCWDRFHEPCPGGGGRAHGKRQR